MSVFEQAIGFLVATECNHLVPVAVRGGAMRWGVTLTSYRNQVPAAQAADIAAMNRAQATAFYMAQFWNRLHINRINDQDLANRVFELCVNCETVIGSGEVGIKALERAVGLAADGTLTVADAAVVNSLIASEVASGLQREGAKLFRDFAAVNPQHVGMLDGWLARTAGTTRRGCGVK